MSNQDGGGALGRLPHWRTPWDDRNPGWYWWGSAAVLGLGIDAWAILVGVLVNPLVGVVAWVAIIALLYWWAFRG